MKIKTESYILGKNEFVEVNEVYFFGELWDGDGDGEIYEIFKR